jgi:Amt family ammonium transporter
LEVDHVGAVAANAAVSTALSGAAAGVTALFVNLWLEERRTGEPAYVILVAMNGALCGLVSVTSGCAVLEPWAAVVTGVVAGLLYLYSSNLLIRLRIDDVVDAVPVHMFGGAWGVISTGLFASPRKMEMVYETSEHPGWFYSLGRGEWDARLLGCQLIELLFIVAWTLVTMLPFFIWLNYKGWFRADSLEELVGLDMSYHGGINAKDNGGVKKEYVEAYKKHKGHIRQRRAKPDAAWGGDVWKKEYGNSDAKSVDTINMSSMDNTDPEMHQEAAAEEACRDDE